MEQTNDSNKQTERCTEDEDTDNRPREVYISTPLAANIEYMYIRALRLTISRHRKRRRPRRLAGIASAAVGETSFSSPRTLATLTTLSRWDNATRLAPRDERLAFGPRNGLVLGWHSKLF
jgi:hypothetical protein